MQPVQPNQRYGILDVLRGFALLGVMIANMYYHAGLFFAGEVPGNKEAHDLTMWWVHFITEGKFYSIFSLLFGIGFAIQIERAAKSGTAFKSVYRRRLGILLLFGFLHASLLFLGDILGLYALLGFVLLLFIKVPDKTLIRWAFILPLIPIIQHLILIYFAQAEANDTASSGPSEMFLTIAETYKNESFADDIPTNFFGYIFGRFPDIFFTGREFRVFALFLLGFWVTRKGLFRQVEKYRPMLMRTMIIAFAVGIPLNIIYATIINDPSYYNLAWSGIANPIVYAYGVPALGIGFAIGITLLYQNKSWQKILNVFAPVGRTALTIYLMQSLIMTFVFHGWGLGYFAELNATQFVPLGFGLYALQVMISHLWLQFFKYGPFEWVWRTLTYGKAPALLKKESDQLKIVSEPSETIINEKSGG